MSFTPPAISLSQIGYVQLQTTNGAVTPVTLSFYLPNGQPANCEVIGPWSLAAYESTLDAARILLTEGTPTANAVAYNIQINAEPGYYTAQVSANNIVRAVGTIYVLPSASNGES